MFELKFLPSLPIEIIALDEVGRSPLSGPVVIGGIRLVVESQNDFLTLLRSLRSSGVRDSKLLNTEKRQKILKKLNVENLTFKQKKTINYKSFDLSFLTFDVGPEIIDQKNIFQSVLLGMKEVISGLAHNQTNRTLILIDGPFFLHFNPLNENWIEIPVIQGDKKSTLIGLASILAKETRDSYMRMMHEVYPQYGFNENMGYPTKFHREALTIHGPTPIHRMSFGSVKQFQTKLVE